MKFSIVIPTRNRLELLKSAITSILRQNYSDWEIIVSDNASTEDIRGYIGSLNEPRIKYLRSDEFLSITESWNKCIEASSGEYTIMIGDDDIFLKNYFEIACRTVEKYGQPELIYTNAYLYAYPNVIPDFPSGVFQTFGSLHGLPKKESPYFLDTDNRRAVIQATLRFRSIYSTNMQHALIRRSLLEKVKREGKFFHSPYPDIYAMSALFLEAEEILIYPKELVVIGISAKSHGCYAINGRQQDAIDFLNSKSEMSKISSLQKVLIPGSIVFSYWLSAIELFRCHFSLEKFQLELDYGIYRKLQIDHVLGLFVQNVMKHGKHFKELMEHLTNAEKLVYVLPFLARQTLKRVLPAPILGLLRQVKNGGVKDSSYTPLNPPPGHLQSNHNKNKYAHVLDVFEQVEPIDCIK